jgi:hypothetical protein
VHDHRGLGRPATAAGLDYQGESGALNEAVSDMFASNIDGNWQIGEGLPDGAIRDMADPDRDGTNPDNCPDDGRFCQPAHVRDFYVTDNDHGGVHTNSGIPNHAYYNMVQNIGRDASEHVLYDAVTQHLSHDSGFEDSARRVCRPRPTATARTATSIVASTRRSATSGSTVPARPRDELRTDTTRTPRHGHDPRDRSAPRFRLRQR